jgi:hypothetical protein
MYFQLTKEEVKFLKRQLPTIRLNGYDIEKFQSIMKSLDSPIKAIPEKSITSESKQEEVYSNSKKYVTKDDFYGRVKQNEVKQEVLVDEPVSYEEDILENNSFLKPPKIEKTIKEDPPSYEEQLTKLEKTKSLEYENNEVETLNDSIDSEKEIPEVNDSQNNLEEEIEEEEQDPIQTEPDDSIFRNQSTDVESASIFSVVDSRTQKNN